MSEEKKELPYAGIDRTSNALRFWRNRKIPAGYSPKALTAEDIRRFWIKRFEELMESNKTVDSENTEPLSMVMDYNILIHSFSKKLGRVMSRY